MLFIIIFHPYSFLTSFPSQLPQIYEGYISSGTFTLPDKSPGSWAVYSPTAKAYFLKFSYIFSLKKDYSKLATCQHLTSSGNLINAENYHYANKSKGAICSHPTMIKSNEGKVSYCSMILDHPAACPMFQEDKKLISSYKVSSKHSDSSHVISSYVARFLDQIHIFVENSQNQEQVFNVRLSNIDDISYDQILSEADVLINEALTAYPSTFFQVEKEEINSSVSVSLSPKKSYISSLV